MKAMQYQGYGGPARIAPAEIETPQPSASQLLVKVAASSVNPIDWKLRNGSLRFLAPVRFPSVPGFDLAGEVVETGAGTRKFKAGERVYACLAERNRGACAEYAVVEENLTARTPDRLNDFEATAIPLAGMTALQALRNHGSLASGQRLLIVGASGGVGHYAVQIGKALGAHVTAVCSGRNADWVRDLGADAIIDYTVRSDFAAERPYDVVLDCIVSAPLHAFEAVMAPQGVYLSTLPTPSLMLRALLSRFTSGRRVKIVMLKPKGEDLAFLSRLVETGQLCSHIDRVYPLAELATAHERSQSGRAQGKIVIDVIGTGAKNS